MMVVRVMDKRSVILQPFPMMEGFVSSGSRWSQSYTGRYRCPDVHHRFTSLMTASFELATVHDGSVSNAPGRPGHSAYGDTGSSFCNLLLL
jgi:hypothetical protein